MTKITHQILHGSDDRLYFSDLEDHTVFTFITSPNELLLKKNGKILNLRRMELFGIFENDLNRHIPVVAYRNLQLLASNPVTRK